MLGILVVLASSRDSVVDTGTTQLEPHTVAFLACHDHDDQSIEARIAQTVDERFRRQMDDFLDRPGIGDDDVGCWVDLVGTRTRKSVMAGSSVQYCGMSLLDQRTAG